MEPSFSHCALFLHIIYMNKSKLTYSITASCICLLLSFVSPCQVIPSKNYPQGYFRNPLNIPMSLSGNFGELRPNHYHMGIDIKTLKKENLPVYAAADGYIARIKIEPAGFGRAIYINHPNGFTTLYAHLNDFTPALEAYVRQYQYKHQLWNVFPDVPPGLFPVHKGDLIAYSGNTGGSQAPHLHFEIRRTADDVNLNPMLFSFPLEDKINPAVLRVAIFDRNKSTYEQTPKIVPVRRSANGFVTSPDIITTPGSKVSFAISAYDTHSGSTNPNGIYEAWLYHNGQMIAGFQMDNISYNHTRFLNAHIDYKTRASGGSFLQHMSELPGYIQSIYTKINGDGVLDISDGAVHVIRLEVRDASGNASELRFSIQQKPVPQQLTSPLPGKMFYPLMLDIFEDKECEFYMGENCLYDSVRIRYTRSISSNPQVLSAIHTIGPAYIPLQDSLLVRIKPLQQVPEDKKSLVVMQRFSGVKKEVHKVQWQNGWASSPFRDLGNFQLVVDSLPPVIVPLGIFNGANLSAASRIAFTVRDNLDKFKNFRAELDGKWLRFSNDKGKIFIYRFDEMCPRGEHVLKVSVEDEAGNVAIREFRFTR